MVEIQRVVRRAARRLMAGRFLGWLVACATAGIALAIVMRVADALVAWVPGWMGGWWGVAGALGFACVVVAAVAAVWTTVVGRGKDLAIARVVDERAGLRESLSTAMHVAGQDDGWSRLVVERAVEQARGVDLARALPVRWPSLWFVPIAGLVVLSIVWVVLPERFAWTAAAKEEAAQQQFVQVKSEIEQKQRALDEVLKQAGVEFGAEDEEETTSQRPERLDADQLRRAEIKRLSAVAEKLDEQLRKGEQAQAMRELQRQMRQLPMPKEGPLAPLQKALSRGQFGDAKQELEKLAQELAKQPDSEMAKAAAEQMEELAEQLQKLAEDSSALQQRLAEAGLSKEQAQKLASDPQKLAEALEAMQGLTQEQKQELQKMAEASASACEACAGLGASMGKMSQALSQGEMGESASGAMQGLGEQLSSMEMTSQQLSQMRRAMQMAQGQCQSLGNSGEGRMPGQGGNRPWQPGEKRGAGNGTGGPGSGNGQTPGHEEAPFQLQNEQQQVRRKGGQIIGTQLVPGASLKGESRAALISALPSAVESAEEAIESQQVPLEYQNAVRRYYERVKQSATESTPSGEGGGG